MQFVVSFSLSVLDINVLLGLSSWVWVGVKQAQLSCQPLSWWQVTWNQTVSACLFTVKSLIRLNLFVSYLPKGTLVFSWKKLSQQLNILKYRWEITPVQSKSVRECNVLLSVVGCGPGNNFYFWQVMVLRKLNCLPETTFGKVWFQSFNVMTLQNELSIRNFWSAITSRWNWTWQWLLRITDVICPKRTWCWNNFM